MDNSILNITNGDAFNEYFLSRFDAAAVPFREAMMDGDTVAHIYSDEFISLRSSELNVTPEHYRANMVAYDALNNGEYSEICLWFGKDTFCQMNLLTLLAYLEQTDYRGKVRLNYIDDETFEILEEDISVELGIYRELYEDILIRRTISGGVGVLDIEAVGLYFDYRSDSGVLAKTVRENSDMDHTALVCLLLEISKAYGLSDTQAEKLIGSKSV